MKTLLYKRKLSHLILVISCFLTLSGCAGKAPNMQTILINASRSYPNIWRLVTATCYVLGFMMIVKMIYHLKVYGEGRTMMSSQNSLKGPLTWALVGTALMYTPTVFQVFMWTTFNEPNIVNPLTYTVTGWSKESMSALVGLIQLVGLFSFVRGLLLIGKSGDQHSQGGVFAKGLTHIVGGLFAINIVGTIKIIQNTFFGVT
jgi:intracellular multiplication protein IcmC